MISLSEIELNAAQQKAEKEIGASIEMSRQHLLTGDAGTGKTVLVQKIAVKQQERRKKIVLTAPTHKAVAVLERKLKAAGIDIRCQTIHSLLSLCPKAQGDKQIFVRAPKAKPVLEDIIVIDECSMLDASMMQHIERHLSGRAVILCGDVGQLPPVGERESRSFSVMPRSHLQEVVRQAQGNPIIAASQIIRKNQTDGSGVVDWSWCREARGEANTPLENTGVFTPHRSDVDAWIRKGFTSEAFRADPDNFRYLAWTNARVAEINAKIRRWIYPGEDLSTPFISGETALLRSPLVIDNQILIATNEEVKVLSIQTGEQLGIATWEMKVVTESGMDHNIHLPRDWDGYRIALAELADAAKADSYLWENYHDFKAAFINAQQCMALTVHSSQGSTFTWTYLDIPDIRKRIKDNLLEAQQLLLTGATRPSDGLVLVGV